VLNNFKDKKIYHVSDSDLDGTSSRVIAEFYIKSIAKEYMPLLTPDRALAEFNWKELTKYDVVIFTDITPPNLEFYKNILSPNRIVYMFDHHQTARDALGEQENYWFDKTKCATKIFYENLVVDLPRKNRVIEKYVELVNTYDLYLMDHEVWESAKDLSNSMYGYVNWKQVKYIKDTDRYDEFITAQLRKFYSAATFQFNDREQASIKRATVKERTALAEALKTLKVRQDGEGNKYGYFECTAKLSYTAARVLRMKNELKYLVGRSTWDKESLKISLRSQGEFDVRRIAEKFGGGGHFNAAGIELNKETFDKIKSGAMHLV
jgi:oligoribonuclease NrnB/cAMP/cGMP phosphodiesterase (DHH superfamily)